MFVGMCLCLPMYRMKMHFRKKQAANRDPEAQPLISVSSPVSPDSASSDTSKQSSANAVFIPAVADLLATGLMLSGLVFTSCSVYQMLRGAEVVFCAIMSVVFLKHELDWYMKAGIVLTVIGVTLVGCAPMMVSDGTVKEGESDVSTQLLGIGLILLSQLVQSVQMIIEEYLLQDVKMDTLVLAGYEGVWGTVLCIFVVLPLFQLMPGGDRGHLEDSYDSMFMLYHSGAIVFAEFLNCMSVLSYNYFGLTVTQDFTAMHRVIIEASRSLMVWVCDLVIYYWITDGKFGEAWTVGSWIQLLGFAVLLWGSCMYNYTTLFIEANLDALMEEIEGGDAKKGRSNSIVSGKSANSVRSRASSGRLRF
uniref:EamA domain-containing protein n=1 Tax=Eutreptiella gymnastica TaxID=73025 RepID=A0A7S1NDH9_9EUGL